MLDTRKAKPYNEAKIVSIIGPGTMVQGEINSKGTIRIEGAVAGRVQCEDSIVVQETGKVKGDLMAAQVIVSGEVNGNIFAQERLEITSTGKVIGDICAPRVSFTGELFEGKCTMKAPGQAGGPATTSAAPQPA
ncbi:MAG TPA: polymer-forming cytoskeletal protein [Candidatus Hydrogenedentes bacterium]|nr:polymer-forming cytoskeletal protein [Candidatus Hydrogenedentota bacterium]